MKRFEQIIEDQYKRLGIQLEQEDDTESDNESQKAELASAKQATDAAEDEAHGAQTDAEAAKQELAGKQTQHAQKTAATSREKSKNIKV